MSSATSDVLAITPTAATEASSSGKESDVNVNASSTSTGQTKWSLDQLFLLISYYEYGHRKKDKANGDLVITYPSWEQICNHLNLHMCTDIDFTPTECQDQYNTLMERVQKEFKTDEMSKPLLTLRDKHIFILRTLGTCRTHISKKHQTELRKSIDGLVTRIRSIATDDSVDLSDVSDGGGSDSEDENSYEGIDVTAKTKNFSEMFIKMFDIDCMNRLHLPTDALVDAMLHIKKEVQPLDGSEIVFSSLGLPLKQTAASRAVSLQLKNLVCSKIAGASEEEKTKAAAVLHSPANAPTLSKLLEMPPRDRGQPLPSVQSLMTTGNVSSDSGEPLNESVAGTPIANQQDSPAKLLAALGTSATPVNIVMPGSTQGLPGMININTPINPLKTLEDIEIANDYVMESGLVQESMETYDANALPFTTAIAYTVNPEDNKNSIPMASVNAQIEESKKADVLEHTAAEQPEQDVKPNVESLDKEVAVAASNSVNLDAKKASDANKPKETVSGTGTGINSMQEVESPRDVEIAVAEELKPPEVVTEPPVEVKIEVPVKKDEPHRGRGKKSEKVEKPEEHSAPLTRNSMKAKSDVSEDKSTISRRSQTRFGAGAGAIEEKKQEKSDGRGSPKKGSLKASTSSDVHTPNLRSRRGPTPTPGAVAVEEKSQTKSTEEDGDLKEKDKVKIESESASTSTRSAESASAKGGSPKKEKVVEPVDDSDAEAKEAEPEVQIKRKPVIPSPRKERSESGDLADDDNSNSGNDASAKKRLTRRSAKFVPKSEPKSRDDSTDKDESAQSGSDGKTRQTKPLSSRLKYLHDEAREVCGGSIDMKEENADGKRVTRARAQTSITPRTRTKSTGSTKSQINSGDLKTEEVVPEVPDPGPSRATRSRAAAVTTPVLPSASSTPTATPLTEALPSASTAAPTESAQPASPSTTNLEEEKAFRKALLVLWNRIAGHKYANIFRKPISDETVTGYSKKVKKPMDLLSIKKCIEVGAIKTLVGLHRDICHMFFNSVMFNPTSSSNSELSVFDMTIEMASDVKLMFEDFKATQDKLKAETEAKDADETDVEMEAAEEKAKQVTPAPKPAGRKRRNLSTSLNAAEEGKETKRRTLRMSTAAATTATTAWQSSRKKLPASPDIANPTRNE